MTNFERYFDEVKKFGYWGIKDGKPRMCDTIDCELCDFHNTTTPCMASFIKWLTEEFHEKKKLTKKQRLLCEILGSGWIIRGAANNLHYFSQKPQKRNEYWVINDVKTFKSHIINTDILPDFPFIKWEDEEPYSVKEMLTWEVEDE